MNAADNNPGAPPVRTPWQIAAEIQALEAKRADLDAKVTEATEPQRELLVVLLSPIASDLKEIADAEQALAARRAALLEPFAAPIAAIDDEIRAVTFEALADHAKELSTIPALKVELAEALAPIVQAAGKKTIAGESFDLQLSESRVIEVVDPARAFFSLQARAHTHDLPSFVNVNDSGLDFVGASVKLSDKKTEEASIHAAIAARFPGFVLTVKRTPKILKHKATADDVGATPADVGATRALPEEQAAIEESPFALFEQQYQGAPPAKPTPPGFCEICRDRPAVAIVASTEHKVCQRCGSGDVLVPLTGAA